jgi:hypothetical protein
MENIYTIQYKGYGIVATINPNSFFIRDFIYFDCKNFVTIHTNDLSVITYYIDVYKEEYLDDDRTIEEYLEENKGSMIK